MKDPIGTWQQLTPTYLRELPSLSYKPIPQPSDIEESIRLLLHPVMGFQF